MASELGCIGDACNGTGGDSVSLPFWGGAETSSYKLLFVLHILAIIATFGPTLLYPMITRFARSNAGEVGAKAASIPYNTNRRIFLPGLLAAAFFGVLLSADSSKAYEMSKPWVSAAFVVVIALALMSWFFLRPAQKRLIDGVAAGEDGKSIVRSAKASIAAGTGIIHLGLVTLVVLMVWKPGQ